MKNGVNEETKNGVACPLPRHTYLTQSEVAYYIKKNLNAKIINTKFGKGGIKWEFRRLPKGETTLTKRLSLGTLVFVFHKSAV